MNVFNKVTLASLKKNRTRTVVTIIGIMLSAAMICASTTFVASMQNFVLRYTIYKTGDWHGAVYDAAYKDFEDIGSSRKVASATYAQALGYARINSANERKPYLYVLGGDAASGYFETMPVHLTAGELPKSSSEIILPEHLATNGKVSYKIGDTVTLEVGDRILDGKRLGQINPFFTYDSEIQVEVKNDEKLENTVARTYTVVGIYERPAFENTDAPGYTALTVADRGADGQSPIDCHFKMKKPSAVYGFMKETGYTDAYRYAYNTDVLLYSGVSRIDSVTATLYSLAAIVIGLIVFASVSLIYNAFSISVSERTKQFGLLSSVGATRKQLRRMVTFEALTVSAIGIPLGILAGIGGIGITLLLLGDKFSSIVGKAHIPLRLCVSWESVVIAAVIALITVLISAWIPSKRATRVSAVEAIRQSGDFNQMLVTALGTGVVFSFIGTIIGLILLIVLSPVLCNFALKFQAYEYCALAIFSLSMVIALTGHDMPKGLISAEMIARMKPSALLINTARGPVVDSAALAEALKAGRIAGAGIDVFETEPPIPEDHPLCSAPNTLLTPHVAFATEESMVLRAEMVFENVRLYLNGTPRNIMA